MSIRPLEDRVLVKRTDSETKTTGGIILPDATKEKPAMGTVIAVGKGSRDVNGNVHPLDVKEGDQVIFSKFAGTEIHPSSNYTEMGTKVKDQNLVIMKEIDILGIIE